MLFFGGKSVYLVALVVGSVAIVVGVFAVAGELRGGGGPTTGSVTTLLIGLAAVGLAATGPPPNAGKRDVGGADAQRPEADDQP